MQKQNAILVLRDSLSFSDLENKHLMLSYTYQPKRLRTSDYNYQA